MKIFITGGAKNGKSGLAQDLALTLARGRKHYYVATMIPSDREDRDRIAHHILDRAGMGFETVECGRNIDACLAGKDLSGTFLLDSVTALMLNELFPDPKSCRMDENAPERCEKQLEMFLDQITDGVFVSDYIYSDAIRYDHVTKAYRQGLARLDRMLARRCDTVVEMVCGRPVVHKGALPL